MGRTDVNHGTWLQRLPADKNVAISYKFWKPEQTLTAECAVRFEAKNAKGSQRAELVGDFNSSTMTESLSHQ